MANMKIEGLEEYELLISRLEGSTDKLIKEAIFEGAKIAADAISSEIRALPTDNGYGSPSNKLKGISSVQKRDLINGAGLADMQKKGYDWDTKFGFDGYGSTPTKKYPKGLPNILLARSVIAGTSFRQKNPFIRRAVNKIRNQAETAMGESIENNLRKEFE